MAVDMSHRLGWIDDSLVHRVDKILQQSKLPIAPPKTMTVEMFKSIMAVRTKLFGHCYKYIIIISGLCIIILKWQVDKKVADGKLRLILLKGPLGNCVFTGDYDKKALDETLHAFCKS